MASSSSSSDDDYTEDEIKLYGTGEVGSGSSSSSSGDEEDVSKIGNERVQRLAGELLGLSVLEASQLSTILRKRLDIPKPAYGGAAMPAFPMAAFS